MSWISSAFPRKIRLGPAACASPPSLNRICARLHLLRTKISPRPKAPGAVPFSSAFDGADQGPFHEMLLQERINSQNRSAGYEDGSHFHRERIDLLLDGDRNSGLGDRLRRVADEILEHHLQLPHVLLRRIQHGGEEVVPVPDCDEQADRRQHRLGERQDDPEEHRQVVRPVDLGRLLQLVGNAPEEADHDENVPGADRAGQDERPVRIDQAEHFDEQVRGHQSAAEQHREQDEQGEELAAAQPLLGDGVSHPCGEECADKRAGGRRDDRHLEARQDRDVLEDRLIRGRREAGRQQKQAAARRQIRIADRSHDHVPERIDHQRHQQNEKGDVGGIEGALASRYRRHGRFLLTIGLPGRFF
ncbi:hypothetical protein BN871_HY_00050 [Paenibacillus sp. P22]|nr:hypothetical protein BN871_HY_00050 [Paenibacillus sp. P22]